MAYEFVDEEVVPEEGFLQSLGRQTARQGFNIGTRAIGLPGDIMSLINEYITNPVGEFLGAEPVPYEKTLHGKVFPTTEKHREAIEQYTGEYLKPKNKVESFVDNIIEDTALLLSPGGKAAKLTRTVPKAFLKSIGANVAGEIVEGVTDNKTSGDVTKLGSLFLLSLIDTPAAAKQLANLYQKAEELLPAGATVKAERLSHNLNSLKEKITKGRPIGNLAPSEKFVIDEIDKIESLIKDGKIDVAQAWAQKRSINEALQKHLFESPGKGAQQRARNLAKPLSHFLNETLGDYGKKNPEFHKYLKSADEGFGTLAQSQFVSNWIEKNVRYSPVTAGLLHLFGRGIGTAAATAALPYQGAKLSYRIAKSHTLRKIYANALVSAGKEDSKNFGKYLRELDEALTKEESQDKYEFID